MQEHVETNVVDGAIVRGSFISFSWLRPPVRRYSMEATLRAALRRLGPWLRTFRALRVARTV